MIDLSPEMFRELGYRAVDLIAQHLADSHTAPVRRPLSADQRRQLMEQALPQQPTAVAQLLERFADTILPYPMGNNSPRFFAWVNSPSAPLGILAELLAAGLNASVAGGDHAAVYVEHAVLNWLKTIMRQPLSCGALLTSGGSVANLVALGVMRHVKTGGLVRSMGMIGQPAPMVIYTSAQGHSSLQKAVEILGFGTDYLRKIAVDDGYRMDVEALKRQIEADRAAGLNPICVAASAGTVNSGAIDPLDELADLCQREDLWLHVDGAYGGIGILCEAVEALYKGIERADSVAVDPHKWLYVPVECGCVIVRDAQAMRSAFSVMPPYLRDDAELPWFSEYGIQQTRQFRALKLWMLIQQLGIEGYRQLISHDIEMASVLAGKARAHPNLELMTHGPLSIICFRYRPHGMAEVHLNRLNRAIAKQLQQSGEVFLTTTELDGRIVLRACIVNFRTTPADLDHLVDTVIKVGEQLAIQMSN